MDNMKVNRIQMPLLQMSWRMSLITSACLIAEQHIIEATDDISFEMDNFGNVKTITEQDKELQKLLAMQTKATKLLEDEHFELYLELKQLYEIKRIKYNKTYDANL